MTHRSWMFTLNNPDSTLTPDIDWDMDVVRYVVYQTEIGENQTVHFQGYIELNRSQRLTWMRRLIGLERAHFEPRRGTREQAIAYCKKEDTRVDGPYEFGNANEKGQGNRSDIQAVKTLITNGTPEMEIFMQHPGTYLRYQRAISHVLLQLTKPRDWPTECHFYYGKPGLGKSRFIRETYPSAYWKQSSNWWDLYSTQEVVVLDDFYGWLKPDMLFRMADRYPLIVETKGGQRQFLAKILIITSNKLPHQWWSDEVLARIDMEALYRRINLVRHWESLGNFTVYNSWREFDEAKLQPPRITQHLNLYTL